MRALLINSTLLLVLATALGTAGCAGNRQYRTSFEPANISAFGPGTADAVIEVAPNYKLGFVEFDDQGWFWNPKQKNAVEQMIRKDADIGQPNSVGVIMVVFVHGWKNNAAFGNSNIATFQAALQKLSEVELALCQKENRQPRKVVGIYAGWRGLSESIEPFKELSFWGRKAAAQRVGGYGAMTELLMDLESLQKASNDSRPTNLPPSKLVIVGHSFGADAVYNAISQIVTERFVDTIKQEKGQLLKPLGDQVILLNPAFEAARLYDLKQLARSVETYSPEQRPVVSILTSDGDWATHYVFPVGQTIGTVFQSHRSGLQKSANHEAVGWFEPFVTHELHYAPRAAHAPSSGHPPDAMVGKLMLRSPDKLPGAAENILAQRQKWRAESAPEEINYFGDCVLISNGNYRPHDPILVISVDKQIMKDHNDIGNTVLLNFLQEYIPFCENDTSVAVGGVK